MADFSLYLFLGTGVYGTTGGEPAVVASSRSGTLQRDYSAVDYAVPADASPGINVGLGALATLRNQAVVRAVPLVNNAGVSPVSFGALQMAPTHSLSAPLPSSSLPPLVLGAGISLVLA